jgi:sec-independent protein translocase protein TatA
MHLTIIGNILGPDGLILIIVFAIVLLFGGSKLPKLARGLGEASHEFKKGLEKGAQDNEETKGNNSETS